MFPACLLPSPPLMGRCCAPPCLPAVPILGLLKPAAASSITLLVITSSSSSHLGRQKLEPRGLRACFSDALNLMPARPEQAQHSTALPLPVEGQCPRLAHLVAPTRNPPVRFRPTPILCSRFPAPLVAATAPLYSYQPPTSLGSFTLACPLPAQGTGARLITRLAAPISQSRAHTSPHIQPRHMQWPPRPGPPNSPPAQGNRSTSV